MTGLFGRSVAFALTDAMAQKTASVPKGIETRSMTLTGRFARVSGALNSGLLDRSD